MDPKNSDPPVEVSSRCYCSYCRKGRDQSNIDDQGLQDYKHCSTIIDYTDLSSEIWKCLLAAMSRSRLWQGKLLVTWSLSWHGEQHTICMIRSTDNVDNNLLFPFLAKMDFLSQQGQEGPRHPSSVTYQDLFELLKCNNHLSRGPYTVRTDQHDFYCQTCRWWCFAIHP